MATFLILLILTGFSCLIAAYIRETRHAQHKRLKGRYKEVSWNAAKSWDQCVERGCPSLASQGKSSIESTLYELP